LQRFTAEALRGDPAAVVPYMHELELQAKVVDGAIISRDVRLQDARLTVLSVRQSGGASKEQVEWTMTRQGDEIIDCIVEIRRLLGLRSYIQEVRQKLITRLNSLPGVERFAAIENSLPEGPA
jgi:hypothetical protein